MNYTIEKKCHAWIGIWWQVKEDKEIVFKSKRKKDCVFYVSSKIQSGGGIIRRKMKISIDIHLTEWHLIPFKTVLGFTWLCFDFNKY